WLALGAWAMLRRRSAFDVCTLTLLALAVAMSVIAPYQAIRYLSPAAFFMVPVIAAGIDASRRILRPAAVNAVAYATLLLLIVYGGAVICAQAASMRNSTAADWRLLQYAATALADGRDV